MALTTTPTAPRMSSRAMWAYLRSALDRPLASHHLVMASSGLLLALGIMMVLSSSSVLAHNVYGDSYYFVKRQFVFLAVGIPIAWITSRMPEGLLRVVAWAALFVSMLLLILTYTPLGTTVNGNTNWLQIGPDWVPGVQPSEFAKIAMALWGADVLSRKQKLLDQPRHLLVPFLPVTGMLVMLVVFQGDLGTALVMGAILLGMLWMVGAPKRIFVALFLVAGAGVGGLVVTSENRWRRFLGFLSPDKYTLGVNMQPTVGIEAIASGGWWGAGLGHGLQKWGRLSEAHTDYVFAVIAEELGLFGSLATLGLFLTLGYAGLRIALRSDRPFERYLASGITTWFMFQSLINLAVVLRLGPVMGVPLPLVSYGGSALLANLIALGLLLHCARCEPAAREVLTGRRNRRTKPRVTTVVAGADR